MRMQVVSTKVHREKWETFGCEECTATIIISVNKDLTT